MNQNLPIYGPHLPGQQQQFMQASNMIPQGAQGVLQPGAQYQLGANRVQTGPVPYGPLTLQQQIEQQQLINAQLNGGVLAPTALPRSIQNLSPHQQLLYQQQQLQQQQAQLMKLRRNLPGSQVTGQRPLLATSRVGQPLLASSQTGRVGQTYPIHQPTPLHGATLVMGKYL